MTDGLSGAATYYAFEPSSDWYTPGETPTYVYKIRSTRAWANNPKDRRIRPKVPRLAPTSQKLQYTRESIHPRVVTRWFLGPGPENYQDYDERCIPPTLDLSDKGVANWAMDLRLAIRDEQMYIAQDLAEYRQTTSMFKKFAVGIRDAVRAVRKGDVGKAVGLTKRMSLREQKAFIKKRKKLDFSHLSSAILTTDYGVMPLASALYEANERMNHRFKKPVIRRFAQFSLEDGATPPFTHQGPVKWSGRWVASERAVIYAHMRQPNGQFHPGNPSELAWELVPFSFVIDWGFTIGDYLSSLGVMNGVSQVVGTVTRKEAYRLDSKIITPEQDYISRSTLVKGSVNFRSHSRRVINDVPVPSHPRFKVSDSWKNVVDGVALLHSVRHGNKASVLAKKGRR